MPTEKFGHYSLRFHDALWYNGIRSMRLPFYFSMLVLSLCSTGCSVSQYLDKGKPLYHGTAIRITNEELLEDKDKLVTQLNTQVQQQKIGTIALWWWYKLETPKEKGIKKWMQKTLGKPPVYYTPSKANLSLLLMRDYLKDHGYFGADVQHDTTYVDEYRILDSFVVAATSRARIDTVVWPIVENNELFSEFLENVKEGSFIKKNDFYSINILDAERARLSLLGGRNGFYEFSKNNIFYYVDSTASQATASIYMQLSQGNDSLTFNCFEIGKTFVYPNYSRLVDYEGTGVDSFSQKDITIIRNAKQTVHPEVIGRRIGLRQGDYYDQRIYQNSLNQLLDLGVFKYVNYEVKPTVTDSAAVLDQYIYLTQGLAKEIRYTLEATTRTGAAQGIGASASYSDKNVFGGAEDFTVSVNGSIGPQASIADATNTVIATEVGFSTELALPRFIGPFSKYIERTAYFIPRTVFNARVQSLAREDFGLQTISLQLGYRYRANRYVTHQFYPISVDYNRLTNTSPAFEDALNNSERLRLSFTDNAVLGAEYIFQYSDQNISIPKNFWSIEAGFKTSGNLIEALTPEPSVAGDPKEFVGVRINQFFRAHIDATRTFQFENTSLASRIYLGAAIPYGNSDVIPYADQFFAGGPNSIRAFPLRGLGPGAVEPVPQTGSTFLNQSGDIRLELNTEYRFPIYGYFEGAAFIDAGNVWLYKDVDGNTPEGVFDSSTFLEQIAVGPGVGLRLNLDFLIIRVDGGVPLYEPFLPASSRFGLNLDDLQLQIAIGYPF